jgi:hypothetical protein
LYSALICEWRKQRDAGVLAGKRPGQSVGKLTAEQAEIARLTRENARMSKRLSTTEAALDRRPTRQPLNTHWTHPP